ncbi:hypothetical protein GRI89_14595 [Altererythrobacter salegens]|uniref:Uncharacterized protein n=1 Tax=Croceibacterium salegens TaxID=1737568 RepID=A0A6I4SZE9_9SPHN|nr:hypothetical protein [Croceibacterium salegens]MXO60769.1 hypothetical protein [Croceibacterium salegens]
MIVVPTVAAQAEAKAKKPGEGDQPHFVLTILSAIVLVIGLGLIAASL